MSKRLKPHVPRTLPLEAIRWESFLSLLGPAHEVLARFDEITKQVERPEKVFALITFHEALASLEAKKLQTSLEEAIRYPALDGEKPDDLKKVLGYMAALKLGARIIKRGNFSGKLILELHALIRDETGTPKKDIGRWRNRQNWIGPLGCPIEEAYYVPPTIPIMMKRLDNLFKYLRFHDLDPLAQIAIVFSQFLAIHPFMDGNGRVARALVPIFLYKRGVISTPMVYLSAYLLKNRGEYFNRLYQVTSQGDWEGWIAFLLKGLIEDGEANLRKAKEILGIYGDMQEELLDIVPKEKVNKLLASLFAQPIFLPQISEKSISRAFERLQEKGWIVPYRIEPLLAIRRLLAIR